MKSSAPDVLRVYCFLLPLLGFNGVLEAFVQSVVEAKAIGNMNRWMTLWTAIYVAAAYFFAQNLQLRTTGLVYANMINMTCRILWSASYVRGWARDRGVSFDLYSVIPSKAVLLSSIISGALIRYVPSREATSLMHDLGWKLMWGGFLFASCCMIASVLHFPPKPTARLTTIFSATLRRKPGSVKHACFCGGSNPLEVALSSPWNRFETNRFEIFGSRVFHRITVLTAF